MQREPRIASGRPRIGEYPAYSETYVEMVAGNDAISALAAQIEQTLTLLLPIEDQCASAAAYAPEKWNLKQVVGHMSDDERVFAYRLLCAARNDPIPRPSYEGDDYVRFGSFEERRFNDLVEEFRCVRQSTIALLTGLPHEAWLRRGTVSGSSVTVRGLAFHIAGHELHHISIIRGKYLTL